MSEAEHASRWTLLLAATPALLVVALWLSAGGWPPLVRGTAVDVSLRLWEWIFGLGGDSLGAVDPRTLPLLLAQGVWVVVLLMGGAPRMEILASLQGHDTAWDAVLAVITLLAAMAAGLLILRRRNLSTVLAAVLLAISPLWLRDIFDPGPGIFWGMALLVVLSRDLPVWIRVCGLGAHVATSPLGVPLLLGAVASSLFSAREEDRRRWASTLVLSLPAACLWNPEILLVWSSWWDGAIWHLRLLGFLGPMPEPYIQQVNPLTLIPRELGYAVPIVVGAGLVRRLRFIREPESLMTLFLFAGLLSATLWGRLERRDLVALAPFLAMLAGDGALWLWDGARAWIQPAARRAAALVLLALVLVPVGAGGVGEIGSWTKPSAEKACLAWLETNVKNGEWVVVDPSAPAPRVIRSPIGPGEDDQPRYLRIPTHRLRPDLYRAGFWSGWYLPFDHLVLSARTVGPLLEKQERYRDILSFYTDALMNLPEEATFGGEGWRDPKISILSLPGDSLGQGWMERLQAGPMEGLRPDFLQSLGSALGEVGASDEALVLLTRSLSMGNRSASLFVSLGALHLTRREYKDAVAVLNQGLELFPDHPILLHNLGLSYARGGLARRAVRIYGRLLTVAPWNHEARLDLAAALLLDGQEERARRVLEDYLARVPPEKRPDHVDELVRRLLPGGG